MIIRQWYKIEEKMPKTIPKISEILHGYIVKQYMKLIFPSHFSGIGGQDPHLMAQRCPT